MSDSLDITTLVNIARAACEQGHNWQPEHPQYIEGLIYLTQEQWDVIRAEWPVQASHNTAEALWGIPAKVIKPNEGVALPSGKTLVYSSVMNSFYVFPEGGSHEAR